MSLNHELDPGLTLVAISNEPISQFSLAGQTLGAVEPDCGKGLAGIWTATNGAER